jgi:hypothetical protein
MSPDAIAKLAREHGHDVTADDVRDTLTADVELSEWELSCVDGGSGGFGMG